uniref:Ig-like domain-containing protein n=1 Tax=Xiphophorus couchianus TaxID=32473 RepID=A0A3B5KSM4_9TELE
HNDDVKVISRIWAICSYNSQRRNYYFSILILQESKVAASKLNFCSTSGTTEYVASQSVLPQNSQFHMFLLHHILQLQLNHLFIFSKDITASDAGTYYCAVATHEELFFGNGTFLDVQGNTVGTSNYRVVQKKMVSDSNRPDNYVTLQCSILSDFENNSCSEDLSVFWFRSDKSHPDIIYTDGNRTNRCQKKIDDQTGRVYNFSRKISSSDDGTYYCAVATCGEILFGNGTKLEGCMILYFPLKNTFSTIILSRKNIFFVFSSQSKKTKWETLNFPYY